MMKKLMSITMLSCLGLTLLANTPNGDEYEVKNDISTIEWKGEKVTGEHYGTINVKSGTLNYSDNQLVGGSVIFDMSSISVDDIEDEEYNMKLTKHLKSEDFFHVDNHKTATFEIKSVTHEEDNRYQIEGDLTIKGITKKLSFPATILKQEDKIVAIGEATVDRTEYDIKYRSGKFFESLGDKAIYDDFTVKIKIGAVKK